MNGSWQDTFDYFRRIKWVKAGTIKKDSCDEELKKQATRHFEIK